MVKATLQWSPGCNTGDRGTEDGHEWFVRVKLQWSPGCNTGDSAAVAHNTPAPEPASMEPRL